MTTRTKITLAIAAVFVLAMMPLGIRLAARLRVWHLLTKNPAVMERMAVMPTEKVLPPPNLQRRVSLGYAEVDFGATPMVLRCSGKDPTVLIATNQEVSLFLFLPLLEEPVSTNQTARSAGETSKQTDTLMKAMREDPVQTELGFEKARPQSPGRFLFMSTAAFQDYLAQILKKGGLTELGRNEVFYFKTATVRGLVRLGKTPKDRTVGFVMMSSLDGKLLQSIIVDMDKHSHQDIGKILEPILSSFTFRLHERVSRAELGHLVQKAGIPAR